MANPNIVNVSEITGNTVRVKLTTAAGTVGILTNTSSSNKVFKINTIRCANSTNSGISYVNVGINQVGSGVTQYLVFGVEIPAGTALAVLDKNSPIYLTENTRVAVSCTSQNADIIISYEDIS